MGFCGLPKRLKPYIYIEHSFYRCKQCRLGHCSITACIEHILENHPGTLPSGMRYGQGGRKRVAQ